MAAALGDIDAAYKWFETFIREHEPSVVIIPVFTKTYFPDIARQPRFLAILDRLRLPH